jgi:hypothetical protein
MALIKKRKTSNKLIFIKITYCSILLIAIVFTREITLAQSLAAVTEETCTRGDCLAGTGTLELITEFGKGSYVGEFKDGEFNGFGRLEIPISFLAKSVYRGNWANGIRQGRGTYWNGKGNLYIGQWGDDKRNGQGSYFFNLPEWKENQHTEHWLSENTENYSGQFVNDHYQGQGTYRWSDGTKFVGGFFAGNKHGQGTFYYDTGAPRPQWWEYGNLAR